MRKWFFILIIPALAGCSNKSDDGGTRVTRGVGAAGVVNNNPNDAANCGGTQCGSITGTNQTAFQNAIFDFLGGDSSTIGQVSSRAGDQTGFRFHGRAATNTNFTCGQNNANVTLNYASSTLSLIIFDSIAVSGQDQPMQLTFNGAAEGAIQGNQFYITFEDQYGNFTLEGNIGPQTTTGFADFVNYDGDVDVPGPRDVWQFTVPTRAFFSCQ